MVQKRKYELFGACLAFGFALTACTGRSIPAADKWLGQWNGPEGTFLKVEGGMGRYKVTIQDLDGPKSYAGTAVGEELEFDRNGKTESIRATNGVDTGMKWLSEKSNCLTIRPGEGFCRD